jgi:hypothetical protein
MMVNKKCATMHNTSRELLIASLLIAGTLVFYASVVQKFRPPRKYPRRITPLCAGDNFHTADASTQNVPGISPGGPTPDGAAHVHCYPRRIG